MASVLGMTLKVIVWGTRDERIPRSESAYSWTVEIPGDFVDATSMLHRHGLYVGAQQAKENWGEAKPIWFPPHSIIQVSLL